MAFIHWVSVAFSPRSWITTGRATLAMVASMMTRATPMAIPTSAIQRDRFALRVSLTDAAAMGPPGAERNWAMETLRRSVVKNQRRADVRT